MPSARSAWGWGIQGAERTSVVKPLPPSYRLPLASSRWLCDDVPLYDYETQRRCLALHLPHYPLPVGCLIGLEPPCHVCHPVFRHCMERWRCA